VDFKDLFIERDSAFILWSLVSEVLMAALSDISICIHFLGA